VDTSTVDPDTSKENAEISEQQGVGYLDCPVLGRPGACGNWTLPVGGNKRYLEIVKPILDTFASRIIPVGPSGYGNLVKLLNNLMFGAINSITCEIFALSQSLNMEPNVLFDTIANSGAGTVSNLFKELGPKIIDREFSPVFSIDNLHKDIALGIALATESGISLNISEIGQELNEKAQAAGLGQEDTAAVVKVYEDLLPLRSEKER
jgi:3-hydroxyisobutyrate dehydrogenase-like beta-hydroxyacid dehydrogenase